MPVWHVADRALGRGNLSGEASEGEDASRNASELDSAPLRYWEATRLPDWMKSIAGDEGTGMSSRRASPGWLEAAGVDRSIEEPGRPGVAGWRPDAARESITAQAATAGDRRGA